jgi:hypothetical protein
MLGEDVEQDNCRNSPHVLGTHLNRGWHLHWNEESYTWGTYIPLKKHHKFSELSGWQANPNGSLWQVRTKDFKQGSSGNSASLFSYCLRLGPNSQNGTFTSPYPTCKHINGTMGGDSRAARVNPHPHWSLYLLDGGLPEVGKAFRWGYYHYKVFTEGNNWGAMILNSGNAPVQGHYCVKWPIASRSDHQDPFIAPKRSTGLTKCVRACQETKDDLPVLGGTLWIQGSLPIHWQISGTTFHGQIKPKKRWIWNERFGFSLSMGHS